MSAHLGGLLDYETPSRDKYQAGQPRDCHPLTIVSKEQGAFGRATIALMAHCSYKWDATNANWAFISPTTPLAILAFIFSLVARCFFQASFSPVSYFSTSSMLVFDSRVCVTFSKYNPQRLVHCRQRLVQKATPASHLASRASLLSAYSTMAEPSLKRPKKLIACCDGTWMNSDKGFVKGSLFSGPGHLQTPSNVTRIGRAILPEDRNHHPQIVYYQSGIGSGNTTIERLVAYSFLANNYTHGDSIFLLGFSRGAFTARSIGGLIGGVGLLTKDGLPWFYLIFKDWENAGVPEYKPLIQDFIPNFYIASPPHDIVNYLNSYRAELIKRNLTREVSIQAIGVWDTVGALGIPTPKLFQKIGLPDFLHEYKFLDTTIDNHVKYAFHALALDEQRASYSPTIWERPPGCTTVLKQVWFPGVHSNVGGSYDDTGIADITLAWMMSNLAPWIDFNEIYIRDQSMFNQFNLATKKHERRGWALGKIYDSCKFPTNLSGREPRTPAMYHQIDYFTNQETEQPLRDTNETVHASVHARILMNGTSYEDEGPYLPEALQDWDLDNGQRHSNPDGSERRQTKQVKWVYTGSDPRFQGKIMLEDRLGDFELDLLQMDPVASSESALEDAPGFEVKNTSDTKIVAGVAGATFSF
ncbi:uncharacterized protein BDR25DRAFT_394200 [Lindgomyces ingoldianus]|uniref:Uncharacterized protein n=1 Tax=Lindgomyces ingoldianus TaxID=673940 RepID=A0ACB6QUK4_9PLEO|nr:uncharacterized protein BDR25DRAFT_394200 [Lindgomyces ingoldianus]KAF2469866.1 hypothetical protein BDR25DRAFT_394200 [Lindgomyces ingoldianus]